MSRVPRPKASQRKPTPQARFCLQKRCYETRTQARDAMTYLLTEIKAGRARAGEGRMNTYHCRICGDWHVGHLPAEGKPDYA